LKKLDRYIFISFLKTFLVVFVILVFVFLLQSIWLYISELAGKDLDAQIIAKFLVYVFPNLMPMILPLTVLVASIMTFGNFGENYEFAAMKSSGISLQRAMRSLIVFITFLSVLTFFFANTVIPWSEFKSNNLRRNISQRKPAMAIVEGVFTQVQDINIKVEKKTGENGQFLHDIIIHKKKPNRNGNYTVIKAKEGELVGKGSNTLTLILKNGNYYDEIIPDDYRKRRKKPFVKSYFDTYNYNIDISGFNNVDMEKEKYKNGSDMLDMSELRVALDSFSDEYNQERENFSNNLYMRSGADRNLGPEPDKGKKIKKARRLGKSKKDTVSYDIMTLAGFYESYPLKQKRQIVNIAQGNVRGTISNIRGKKTILENKAKRLNKFELALHKKFSIAAACFILFFVGASLGAIIRKGGVGLPLVVAVLLFLVYHFIGIFAENSAEDGTLSPAFATWLSTGIMFPLSIYLFYRATTDQGFVNMDGIVQPIRKVFRKIGFGKRG
jgi:lipopolysaccharide export system permease protein